MEEKIIAAESFLTAIFDIGRETTRNLFKYSVVEDARTT
jgi:hypothetical protein